MPCLYLAIRSTSKEELLLKHNVLKGDWYHATIKLFHSRNILIFANAYKRAFNMFTIELKFSTPTFCRGENQSWLISNNANLEACFVVYLSAKLGLTKNHDYMNTAVDSLGFYDRSQTDTWRQIQLNTCISFFQASTRDCKNCTHNCENHSFIDFNLIYGIVYISFHHSFIPHGLIRTHNWPVPYGVPSGPKFNFWIRCCSYTICT